MNPLYISYNDVKEKTDELYVSLTESNYEPDFIVPLSRNGIIPSITVANRFNSNLYVLNGDILNQANDEPNVLNDDDIAVLSVLLETNKKILFLDCLMESEDAINTIRRLIEENILSPELWDINTKVGTLYLRNNLYIEPDFCIEKIVPNVIYIFQWEE